MSGAVAKMAGLIVFDMDIRSAVFQTQQEGRWIEVMMMVEMDSKLPMASSK